MLFQEVPCSSSGYVSANYSTYELNYWASASCTAVVDNQMIEWFVWWYDDVDRRWVMIDYNSDACVLPPPSYTNMR